MSSINDVVVVLSRLYKDMNLCTMMHVVHVIINEIRSRVILHSKIELRGFGMLYVGHFICRKNRCIRVKYFVKFKQYEKRFIIQI